MASGTARDEEATVIFSYDTDNKGPMSGVCSCQGEYYWFQLSDWTTVEKDGHRDYSLYSLPSDDMQKVLEEQQRFREEVGYFKDHDPVVFQPRPFCRTPVRFVRQTKPYQVAKELTPIQIVCSTKMRRLFPPVAL